MEDYKRSGQIPAFGNWDYANDLPITQYFECARQAGLVRYSSSSGESDPYVRGDLYAVDFKKPAHTVPPPRKTRGRGKGGPAPHVKENTKKQGKVCDCDVTEPPTRKPGNRSKQLDQYDTVPRSHHPPRPRLPGARLPKPVDEDLYRIPPELLHTTKRKKMLGFISRCLVPAACAS
ncbi:Pathogenic type III effector avirulence factor Avr AvrRpt-cleavage: cleavage site protein [Quillaja saponaria]|uniref:Pathogenic type III effector avirulence factor Avr AvrRpt-cleavage: cleavage site protein n=1 Tax=Quillaja saponaria TaxID=32244 RepID=A0AAD7QB14_QUISA|nr:Pathogenic type III effector avirulence factor Avr AvrRpt-cleavage: cleavage site protein [Quillaja saponaria]